MFKRISLYLIVILSLVGCTTLTPREQFVFGKVHGSTITDKVEYNLWTSQIKINPEKRGFTLEETEVFWAAVVTNTSAFPKLTAYWIAPDGSIHLKTKCNSPQYQWFFASMSIKDRIKKNQQGQWKVEVRNENNELIDNQIFYIGPSQDFASKNEKDIWDNQDYDISSEEAIILLKEEKVEVMSEFLTRRTIHAKIKILSEEGKKWAQVYIPVINGHDIIKIKYAHTLLPNGKVVKAEKGEVTLYVEQFPTYVAYQVYAMTMPAIEVGAIIEYEVEITKVAPLAEGMYFDGFGFENFIPVSHFRYEVVLPLEMKIFHQNFNHNITPKIIQDPITQTTSYVWKDRYIKPIKPEIYMPSLRDVSRYTIISTTKEWDQVATWWRNMISQKYTTNEEIKKKTEELIQDAKTDQEKIKRIYEYVQKNIRYVGLTFGKTVYEPMPAELVWKNKYGDCKDQSMLLISMLKSAGIESYTALIRTKANGPQQILVPSLGEFDHAIVAVKLKDKYIFLDPTTDRFNMETLNYMIEGGYAFVVNDDLYEFIKIEDSPSEENGISTTVSLDVQENLNITGNMTVHWIGQNNGLTRTTLLLLEKEKKKDFAHEIIKNAYPYAAIKSFKFKNEKNVHKPLILEVDFEIKNGISEAGDFLVLKTNGDQGASLPSYLLERKYGVDFMMKTETKLDIIVTLPQSIKIEQLPKNFTYKSPFISSEIQNKMEKNKIIQKYVMSNYTRKIPYPDIEQYRRDMDVITKAHRNHIVLTRK